MNGACSKHGSALLYPERQLVGRLNQHRRDENRKGNGSCFILVAAQNHSVVPAHHSDCKAPGPHRGELLTLDRFRD